MEIKTTSSPTVSEPCQKNLQLDTPCAAQLSYIIRFGKNNEINKTVLWLPKNPFASVSSYNSIEVAGSTRLVAEGAMGKPLDHTILNNHIIETFLTSGRG